eukprot:4704205-Pyramimonas_sp.AAC.1
MRERGIKQWSMSISDVPNLVTSIRRVWLGCAQVTSLGKGYKQCRSHFEAGNTGAEGGLGLQYVRAHVLVTQVRAVFG